MALTFSKKIHRLRAAADGLKDIEAGSTHRPKGKEGLLTTKRLLPGDALHLRQVCCAVVVVVDGSDASTANASLQRSWRWVQRHQSSLRPFDHYEEGEAVDDKEAASWKLPCSCSSRLFLSHYSGDSV